MHFQNTIQMTDALIKAGTAFRLMDLSEQDTRVIGASSALALFVSLDGMISEQRIKVS